MPPLLIRVNGRSHETQAAPETPLLYVLRNELQLNGPKFGCGLGQCGACTVHLAGVPVRSCVTPVSATAGKPIVTVEGLGTEQAPHALQRAFIDEQAGQCGYCLSGMIMTAAALLAKTPKPTEAQVREALGGNLCRCGSHLRILRAIARAAGGGTQTAARSGGAQ
jgi:nicotinate dehydrogenase subunit A